ncbi:kinase-like domain-containing protein, partial [Syncephalis fuscata]
ELQCHEFVHSHPNVLSLLDCIVHDEDMFFVLEYCPEGDLFNAIMTQNANGTLTQREREVWAMDIFRDIINSISWCHKNSVWHRDIKPENVLIASDGRALLADFGLATTYAQTYDHGVGSAIYMAPELLNTSGAWHGKTPIDSAKVDIWALGVLLINMLSGRNPWGSAHYADAAFQIYLNRPEALRETFNLSEDGWYIIKRMLAIDPYERPTIEQVSSWIDMVKSWTI